MRRSECVPYANGGARERVERAPVMTTVGNMITVKCVPLFRLLDRWSDRFQANWEAAMMDRLC